MPSSGAYLPPRNDLPSSTMIEPEDLTVNQKAVLLTLANLPRRYQHDRRFFEKILFLLTKAQPEALEDIDQTFEGYKMGPYSEFVDELNHNLEDLGLAKKMDLTPEGRALAPKLEHEADLMQVVTSLKQTLELTKDFDVNDLLYLVYRLYPEFAKESEYPEEARSHRLEHFSVPISTIKEGGTLTVTSDKGSSISVERRGGKLVLKPVA